MNRKQKVVVIGGGHGLATMLRGLKHLNYVELTSIVAVSDSGGSTGRLRSHFNVPAIGDIRNVMSAMAQEETMFQFLMNYRFSNNTNAQEDILGHNLGNLILLALMDRQGGSLTEAISAMSSVLNVKGNVYPSSLESINLYARMSDGTIVKGEANIPTMSNQIQEVFFSRDVKGSYQAIKAIEEADYIILGIGSLFTSILPNLIINDIREAINRSKAPVIYYCNMMTELGETDGYTLEDHVDMLVKHGVRVDAVVKAIDEIPEEIEKHYLSEGQKMVKSISENHSYQIIERNLLNFDKKRVWHSATKIGMTFKSILDELEVKP